VRWVHLSRQACRRELQTYVVSEAKATLPRMMSHAAQCGTHSTASSTHRIIV
jgi:hypothetical protein